MHSPRSKFLHVVVCLFALYAVPATAQPSDLFISEYIEGSSNNKAIEIYNGTGAPVNLSGYSIRMYFNGNPVSTLTINLAGTLADGGVHVVAHALADAAILAKAQQTNGSGWFNGDDAVALVKNGVIIDVIGQIGFDPGTEWGSGLASTADNTLRRKASITAGDTDGANAFDPSLEWDGFAVNTFDGLGIATPPPPPTALLLEIHEIQGSGASSPHAGKLVETLDNIVTALTTNGFFIQTPSSRADALPETSQGIFVFTGSAPTVSVGDQVDVTAKVDEFFEFTELATPTITVDSSGHELPAAVMFGATLPSPAPSAGSPAPLERFEGMRVRVENAVVTGPTNQFGETAVVATGARAYREPGIAYPGLPGAAVWDGNPEIFEIDGDVTGSPAAFVAGAVIDVAEGPLAYSFGDYQIWPTTLTYGAQPDIFRAVRARNAGEFTVGSQNLLRFFDADGTNGPDDGTPTPAQFEARLAKASLHIRTALGSPDILVIEEVENIDTANALASRLNADDSSLGYSAHLLEGHDIGGIDTGVLVRSTVAVNSVTQLGYDSELSLDNSKLHDRPPVIVDATYIGNGAAFPITVIGVHNRSLGGVEGTSPSANRVRQKRLEQALEIANYVQGLQTANPSRRVVLTGDFNAFEFSDGYVDAIGIITGNLDPAGAVHPGHVDVVNPNLVDLITTLPASERYTFVFDGSAQALDHTLTTTSLSPYLRGLQIARGNADAPLALRDDPTTPLATSDHDGEVLFVMTDFDGDGLPDDQDACPQSVTTFVTVGACTTTVPEQVAPNGCSLSDALSAMAGTSANHGLFVSQASQWLNELRSGNAIDNKQRSEIQRCVAAANVP